MMNSFCGFGQNGLRVKARWVLLVMALAAFLSLNSSAQLQPNTAPDSPAPDQNLTLGKLAYSKSVSFFMGGAIYLFTSNADGTDETGRTDFPPYLPSKPSWSPDGSKIAFASNDQIYTLNISGGVVNLTNSVASGLDPSWSSTDKIAYESNGQIWTMNGDGSNQAPFTAITRPTPTDPAWSPDGSKLAFVSGGDIYVINANGTGELPVTTGAATASDPTWSPDGLRIAFGRSGIYVINLDGSNEMNLSGFAFDREPAWSLDNAKIAFVRKGTNVNGIYLMNPDGTNQVRAIADAQTPLGNNNNSPAWQPTPMAPGTFTISGRITRSGASLSGLTVNLTGSATASTVTDTLGNYQFSNLPAGGDYTVRPVLANHNFSPINHIFNGLSANQIADFAATEVCLGSNCAANGKIAFVRDSSEIYIMNQDGSNQTNLTNNPATDTEPAFSPDGSKIAFSTSRDGNSEVYVMNANGSGVTRLTFDAASDSSPTYSPDGSKITFASTRDGNSEIYTMNADGTNQVRRTTNTTFDGSPSYSPDGNKILYVGMSSPNRDLFTMNADGSNPANLTNQSGFYTRPFYSPDGSKIIFINGGDITAQTNWVMNANGTNRRMLSNGGDGGGKFSPDGREVVFSCCNTSPTFSGLFKGAAETTELVRVTTGPDRLPDWQPIRPVRRNAFDFDGDGLADFGVYRPGATANAPSFWYVLRSSNNTYIGEQFGSGEDKIVPADFNGDLLTEIAVWRPSTGTWYTSLNPAINYGAFQWGTAGDIPVPGDFDGDGRADYAVFRPGNGYWYIRRSSEGSFVFQQFGQNGDKPLIGDFDGDGAADLAYVRIVGPDLSWNILQSSNGAIVSQLFGLAADRPTVMDFDGDGRANIAVFRNSTGRWYTSTNPSTNYGEVHWGQNGDTPAAADFDGDGKSDVSVFRPSIGIWYVNKSSDGGIAIQPWGANGDLPVEAAYVP
jgi:Tol biopolymer transport system component